MDPYRNPFSPGAGTPPPELAGRERLLERAKIVLGRIRVGRSEKSLMLVGLRGVGKTVLLNKIGEMAEADGYKVVMVEAHENKPLPALLLPALRQLLFVFDRMENVSQKVKRAFSVLRSFFDGVKLKYHDIEVGLDVIPEKGTADSGDLEADLGELLLAVAEAAADRGSAIAVIIDELQYLSEIELSALIMGIHKVAQKKLSLVLVGAGLPQLVGLCGRSKSYAERLFDFPEVGALEETAAKNALQEPARSHGVAFTDAALDDIIAQTEGYPYYLQEWGYHAWNLAGSTPIDVPTIQRASEASIRRLDENFFRVRFDRCSPRERDYLRALAEFGAGAQGSGEVAELLGTRVQSVAPLRSALIKKGMIYSPAHGSTAFTVPLFGDFMKRNMPMPRRRP